MAQVLRDLMTLPSRLGYLTWRATNSRREVIVRLRSGERLIMRPGPSQDIEVAKDIFVGEMYRATRPLSPETIDCIVDVGANVGYSVVYFCNRYHRAQILAFEPHPIHLNLLKRALVLNRIATSVTLYPVAAGVANGEGFLIDVGSSSRIAGANDTGDIPVPVADFFEVLGDRTVGLLKLDCEGSEYALIMDPRFAKLRVHAMIMEWHSTSAHPKADRELFNRLESLGWELDPIFEDRNPPARYGHLATGIVWAYQNQQYPNAI